VRQDELPGARLPVVRNRDPITFDASSQTITLGVPAKELKARLKRLEAAPPPLLHRRARQIGRPPSRPRPKASSPTATCRPLWRPSPGRAGNRLSNRNQNASRRTSLDGTRRTAGLANNKNRPLSDPGLAAWLAETRGAFAPATEQLTEPVLVRWKELLAALNRGNRTMTCEDSLIAATALHHGHTVATHNSRHFEPAGVQIIDSLA